MKNYPKKHNRLLKHLQKKPDDMENYADLLRCNCLWAEKNIKDNNRSWINATLAQEILQYGPLLLETKQMSMLELVHQACSRIKKTLSTHPRLTVQILKLDLKALSCIENETGQKQELTEKIQREIEWLETNIGYADRGEFDKIEEKGYLRRDPVEWTAAWEEVIDAAEEKVAEILKKEHRYMGFCHMYWRTLATVLDEEYGIFWCNPQAMNPRVRFD